MAQGAVQLASVPETRFGRWFLGTPVWTRYVVEVAVDQFVRQLPSHAQRPRRILDAGCGAGVSLSLLERRFEPESIIALDIDASEIGRCRQHARHRRCAVHLMVGNAARLALPSASVDMVFCHQTLHHARDQEAMLREFHRVLVPGGWLLLAESCRSFILSTPVRVMFRHPNEVQRSAVEYQEMVRATGFALDPQHAQTTTPFWSLWDWGLSSRLGLSVPAREPTQVTLVACKLQA